MMKPFLVKYKSRVINIDFIDVAGNVYWGREIYPEASAERGWVCIDLCKKIDTQDDNNLDFTQKV